jgi:hypothetical protein
MLALPYRYVRYTWWREVDLDSVSEELGGSYRVEAINLPSTKEEISLFKIDRERMKIEADTLRARLSSYRVVLYQRENAPFTARDMALRGRALELYPHNSPTPFPVQFSIEPEFEVAEEPPVTAVSRKG